jgi:hypothetical protein
VKIEMENEGRNIGWYVCMYDTRFGAPGLI